MTLQQEELDYFHLHEVDLPDDADWDFGTADDDITPLFEVDMRSETLGRYQDCIDRYDLYEGHMRDDFEAA